MAARTKSKVTPKYKTKYKVKNWRAYNVALKQRGDITVWFDEAAIDAWSPPPSGLPGGQRRYSDLAIVTALTLRTVFHLPLRQTEGFVASMIRVMGLELDTPDYSTLSRRSVTVLVPPRVYGLSGPIHLVIDSTGLKMLGDGEWLVHKHKTSNKRRSWRKLHLGVDASGFIVASDLTESRADDATVGVALISRLKSPIGRFTADGAYDTRAIYEALAPAAGSSGTTIVVPPNRSAARSSPAEDVFKQRDAAIGRISEVGRRQWRKESGAHQQARAENAVLRYKRIIGGSLRARKRSAQVRETLLAVRVLNRMAELGMPKSQAVVA